MSNFSNNAPSRRLTRGRRPQVVLTTAERKKARKINALQRITKTLRGTFLESDAIRQADIALASSTVNEIEQRFEQTPAEHQVLAHASGIVNLWAQFNKQNNLLRNKAAYRTGLALLMAKDRVPNLDHWLKGRISKTHARKMMGWAKLVRRFPRLQLTSAAWYDVGCSVNACIAYCLNHNFEDTNVEQPAGDRLVDDEAGVDGDDGPSESEEEEENEEDKAFIDDNDDDDDKMTSDEEEEEQGEDTSSGGNNENTASQDGRAANKE